MMEPLKTNIKICVLLGLFTISDTFRAKCFAFVSNLALTSNTVFLVSISGAFFFKNVSDIEKATYAFYVIAAGLISLAWNGIILKQQTPFKTLLIEYQQIIKKRLQNGTLFNYDKVEANIETFTRRYNIVFASAVVASMIAMPALVAGYHFANGTYAHSVWYLPLVTISPYNQNSTVGHIFTHIIQTTGISSLVAYLCAITTTFFAVCSYIEALFCDLAHEHDKIDVEFLQKPEQKHAMEARKRLIDLINLHDTILRLLNDFRGILNGIVFWLFLIGISWLCSGLFQLKPSWDLMFVQNMSNLGLIVSCMYTYCSNGSTVTYSSSDFSTAIYKSCWYEYPVKVQPFLVMMMCRAQKPFYFTGYEFSKCSLETFTKLMNMSFSILMVLRAVDSGK